MVDNNNSDIGSVKIANEIIAAYVFDTVIKVPGVAGFSGGLSDTISQTILGKENRYKGIKIDFDDIGYTIDIFIIIEFGTRIPSTAWTIQKNVKKDLEDIMFLDIESINIHVQGVLKKDEDDTLGEVIIDEAEVFDVIHEPGKEE